MVARIRPNYSIEDTFEYNEQKVKVGYAELLMAENYPLELSQMNKMHRLNMLRKTAALRESVEQNCVHISLNFPPGEDLPQATLKQIAEEYMDLIGFGEQPYLVYRHFDAAHPHLHIVSIKVRPDGTGINMNYIGKKKSKPATEALEIKYNLVKADQDQEQAFELKPINAGKVIYGKSETKRAISNVLNAIIPAYNFTSLGELNAILKGYNVMANPGNDGSRIKAHHGLTYTVLDKDGNPKGKQIPASRFYLKPTLERLDATFKANVERRKKEVFGKTWIRNAVDLYFMKAGPLSLDELKKELAKESIGMVIHRNKEGGVFGLTYVDFKRKYAYNGNVLGKAYGANGLQGRCERTFSIASANISTPEINPNPQADKTQNKSEYLVPDNSPNVISEANDDNPQASGGGLLEMLMQAEELSHWLPYELRRKKKRRKKRKPDNL